MKRTLRINFSGGLFLIFMIILIVSVVSQEKFIDNSREELTIAQVIAAEGCGEGYIGMYMIANTIKNRSEQWNTTPFDIVTQRNQYYGLTSPNKIQLYNQCKDFADELALKILKLPDLTGGAIYFLRPEEKKRKWHKEETIRFKNHIFYK